MNKNKIYIVTSGFLILALIGAFFTSDIDAPSADVEEVLSVEVEQVQSEPEPTSAPEPEPEIIEEQVVLDVAPEQTSDVALASSTSSSDSDSSDTGSDTDSSEVVEGEEEADSTTSDEEVKGNGNSEKKEEKSNGSSNSNSSSGSGSSGGGSGLSIDASEVAEDEDSEEDAEKIKRPDSSSEDVTIKELAQEDIALVSQDGLVVEKEVEQDGEKILVTDQKSGEVIIEAKEFQVASALAKQKGTKTLFVKNGKLLLGVGNSKSTNKEAWKALLNKEPSLKKSEVISGESTVKDKKEKKNNETSKF